jgi:hypothetical protein
MLTAGRYLYGFTDAGFAPPANLCGLRGELLRTITFHDIAAIVSEHPVQPLMPSRRNIEPHHRVVRGVSSAATLVPAAFGHVSESAAEISEVLRVNYAEIRRELDRLAGKCEMTVKLTWQVHNIFDHMVRTSRELREGRDRVFRGREPSMNDKLQVGALFEATLTRERERMTAIMLGAVKDVALDVVHSPARDETAITRTALLVERSRAAEFDAAIARLATLFDASVAIDYSGPWPPYSFVNLRLRSSAMSVAS